MRFSEEVNLRERIHHLIRLKATGTPCQLASRLSIPIRKLHRILNGMKDDGFPICYDRNRERYFYETEVVFEVKFQIAEEVNLQKVIGGNNFKIIDFFYGSMSNFVTGRDLLCSR